MTVGRLPTQPEAGTKVKSPVEVIVSAPLPASVTVWPAAKAKTWPETRKLVRRRASPSTSTSLARRLPAIGTLFSMAKTSPKATGASFTGVTVRARVDWEVAAPSETVSVMTGTVPFQLAKGAKTYLPLAETVSTPLPAIVTDSPAA